MEIFNSQVFPCRRPRTCIMYNLCTCKDKSCKSRIAYTYTGFSGLQAESTFPDRFEHTIKRSTDQLERLLIGRATDNGHMMCNTSHHYMGVILPGCRVSCLCSYRSWIYSVCRRRIFFCAMSWNHCLVSSPVLSLSPTAQGTKRLRSGRCSWNNTSTEF